MKFLFLLTLIVVWTGCATHQQSGMPVAVRNDATKLKTYEFTGRIAVRQEEKGNYGNIRWIKNEGDTEITLTSPLGQVVAQIHQVPGSVKLTLADKREFWAENADGLIQQVLGYTLPVGGLNDWLLGGAAGGGATKEHRRPDGLMDRFSQDGWAVRYIDYAAIDNVALPKSMVLARGDLEIRLVIDQWILDVEANTAPLSE